MEAHLKERLVGAAVLVAVGVLLIPELLSGPQPSVETAGQAAEDSGVRRYTIDLARRPAAEVPTPVAEAPQVAATEPPSPPAPETPQATESEAVRSEPPVRVVEAPAPVVPPAATPARAASPGLPWAVQVGSFSAQATAERVSNELKARGYDSFVVPFRTGTQTLYRVRVGPMPDREAAEAAVQKLKREGTGATVVASS